MRRHLTGVFSFLFIFLTLCIWPVAALEGPAAELGGLEGNPLDGCQKKFAESLRFLDRERDYAEKKVRYQQALADRCAGRKWYDLGFLECALFVPLFGLILPFFGMMFFGSLRSLWRTSTNKPLE